MISFSFQVDRLAPFGTVRLEIITYDSHPFQAVIIQGLF